jgi:hypothetical protein
VSFHGDGRFGGATIDVVAPSKDVRVVVPKALFLEGSVEGTGGLPFQLSFRTATGGVGMGLDDTGRFSAKVSTDDAGWLFVRSDADDRYALLEGVRPSRSPHVVRLVTGLSIDGRIEGPTGPVKGSVQATDVSRHLYVNVPVRGDGTFSIRGLPPGTYTVSGHVEGFGSFETVKVEAGGPDVVLKARPR